VQLCNPFLSDTSGLRSSISAYSAPQTTCFDWPRRQDFHLNKPTTKTNFHLVGGMFSISLNSRDLREII